MLHVEPKKENGVVRSFRLSRRSFDILAELAEHFDSTQVRVIEAMLSQYGAKVLKEEKRKRAAADD